VEDLNKIVKASNREVYNNLSIEEYNKNESLFNEDRKKIYRETLSFCSEKSGNESHLDIGTGTGNILRISQGIFKRLYAIDISENILIKIRESFPEVNFVAADAENLPFKDNSFNCVTANALLHHLVSHEKLFKEIFRVLKPEGAIYTDHDPNYFFNRFYRLFYKFKYRKKHGFGNLTNDLAEYHNVFSPGINPEELSEIMKKIGFVDVKIKYRLTERTTWKGSAKFAFTILKHLNKMFDAKSFRTHFSIIAFKER